MVGTEDGKEPSNRRRGRLFGRRANTAGGRFSDDATAYGVERAFSSSIQR